MELEGNIKVNEDETDLSIIRYMDEKIEPGNYNDYVQEIEDLVDTIETMEGKSQSPNANRKGRGKPTENREGYWKVVKRFLCISNLMGEYFLKQSNLDKGKRYLARARKQLEKVEQEFEERLDYKVIYVVLYRNIAFFYKKTRDYDKALKILKKVLKNQDIIDTIEERIISKEITFLQLSSILLKLGNIDESYLYCQKSYKILSKQLGVKSPDELLVKIEKEKQSGRPLDPKALKIYRAYSFTYYRMGKALKIMKRKAEALDCLQKSIKVAQALSSSPNDDRVVKKIMNDVEELQKSNSPPQRPTTGKKKNSDLVTFGDHNAERPAGSQTTGEELITFLLREVEERNLPLEDRQAKTVQTFKNPRPTQIPLHTHTTPEVTVPAPDNTSPTNYRAPLVQPTKKSATIGGLGGLSIPISVQRPSIVWDDNKILEKNANPPPVMQIPVTGPSSTKNRPMTAQPFGGSTTVPTSTKNAVQGENNTVTEGGGPLAVFSNPFSRSGGGMRTSISSGGQQIGAQGSSKDKKMFFSRNSINKMWDSQKRIGTPSENPVDTWHSPVWHFSRADYRIQVSPPERLERRKEDQLKSVKSGLIINLPIRDIDDEDYLLHKKKTVLYAKGETRRSDTSRQKADNKIIVLEPDLAPAKKTSLPYLFQASMRVESAKARTLPLTIGIQSPTAMMTNTQPLTRPQSTKAVKPEKTSHSKSPPKLVKGLISPNAIKKMNQNFVANTKDESPKREDKEEFEFIPEGAENEKTHPKRFETKVSPRKIKKVRELVGEVELKHREDMKKAYEKKKQLLAKYSTQFPHNHEQQPQGETLDQKGNETGGQGSKAKTSTKRGGLNKKVDDDPSAIIEMPSDEDRYPFEHTHTYEGHRLKIDLSRVNDLSKRSSKKSSGSSKIQRSRTSYMIPGQIAQPQGGRLSREISRELTPMSRSKITTPQATQKGGRPPSTEDSKDLIWNDLMMVRKIREDNAKTLQRWWRRILRRRRFYDKTRGEMSNARGKGGLDSENEEEGESLIVENVMEMMKNSSNLLKPTAGDGVSNMPSSIPPSQPDQIFEERLDLEPQEEMGEESGLPDEPQEDDFDQEEFEMKVHEVCSLIKNIKWRAIFGEAENLRQEMWRIVIKLEFQRRVAKIVVGLSSPPYWNIQIDLDLDTEIIMRKFETGEKYEVNELITYLQDKVHQMFNIKLTPTEPKKPTRHGFGELFIPGHFILFPRRNEYIASHLDDFILLNESFQLLVGQLVTFRKRNSCRGCVHLQDQILKGRLYIHSRDVLRKFVILDADNKKTKEAATTIDRLMLTTLERMDQPQQSQRQASRSSFSDLGPSQTEVLSKNFATMNLLIPEITRNLGDMRAISKTIQFEEDLLQWSKSLKLSLDQFRQNYDSVDKKEDESSERPELRKRKLSSVEDLVELLRERQIEVEEYEENLRSKVKIHKIGAVEQRLKDFILFLQRERGKHVAFSPFVHQECIFIGIKRENSKFYHVSIVVQLKGNSTSSPNQWPPNVLFNPEFLSLTIHVSPVDCSTKGTYTMTLDEFMTRLKEYLNNKEVFDYGKFLMRKSFTRAEEKAIQKLFQLEFKFEDYSQQIYQTETPTIVMNEWTYELYMRSRASRELLTISQVFDIDQSSIKKIKSSSDSSPKNESPQRSPRGVIREINEQDLIHPNDKIYLDKDLQMAELNKLNACGYQYLVFNASQRQGSHLIELELPAEDDVAGLPPKKLPAPRRTAALIKRATTFEIIPKESSPQEAMSPGIEELAEQLKIPPKLRNKTHYFRLITGDNNATNLIKISFNKGSDANVLNLSLYSLKTGKIAVQIVTNPQEIEKFINLLQLQSTAFQTKLLKKFFTLKRAVHGLGIDINAKPKKEVVDPKKRTVAIRLNSNRKLEKLEYILLSDNDAQLLRRDFNITTLFTKFTIKNLGPSYVTATIFDTFNSKLLEPMVLIKLLITPMESKVKTYKFLLNSYDLFQFGDFHSVVVKFEAENERIKTVRFILKQIQAVRSTISRVMIIKTNTNDIFGDCKVWQNTFTKEYPNQVKKIYDMTPTFTTPPMSPIHSPLNRDGVDKGGFLRFCKERLHQTEIVFQQIKRSGKRYIIFTLEYHKILKHFTIALYFPDTCRSYSCSLYQSDLDNIDEGFMERLLPSNLVDELQKYKFKTFGEFFEMYLLQKRMKGDEPPTATRKRPQLIGRRIALTSIGMEKFRPRRQESQGDGSHRSRGNDEDAISEPPNQNMQASTLLRQHARQFNEVMNQTDKFISIQFWSTLVEKFDTNKTNRNNLILKVENFRGVVKEYLAREILELRNGDYCLIEIFVENHSKYQFQDHNRLFNSVQFRETHEYDIYIRRTLIQRSKSKMYNEKFNLKDILMLYFTLTKREKEQKNAVLKYVDLQVMCLFLFEKAMAAFVYEGENTNNPEKLNEVVKMRDDRITEEKGKEDKIIEHLSMSEKTMEPQVKEAKFIPIEGIQNISKIKLNNNLDISFNLDDKKEIMRHFLVYRSVFTIKPLQMVAILYNHRQVKFTIYIYATKQSMNIQKSYTLAEVEGFIPSVKTLLKLGLYKEIGLRTIKYLKNRIMIWAHQKVSATNIPSDGTPKGTSLPPQQQARLLKMKKPF